MRLLAYGKLGLLLILAMVCLAGCWDIIPIEDRAQVLVIGVDSARTPDNRNQVRLSAQIPAIKNLIQTASNFTDRQKPIFKPLVVEGKSLLMCIQGLENRLFQSMVIGNVKLIIISPGVAADDLLNILTIFLRQPTVSYQTLVMCAEGSAEEIVQFEAPFDIQPALMIGKQEVSALKLIHSFPIKLWELIARIDNGISDPYLPVISLDQENKSYVLEGMKLFQGDKIIATLSADDSYLFGVLTGKVEEGYKEITVKNQEIGFSKVRYKSRVRIINPQNQPQLQVEIKAAGTLLQIPKGFPDRVTTYKLFQKEMEKQLREQVLSFVKKLQALNTDPVGFRKIMENAGIMNWKEVYPRIPVAVKVRFGFRNFSPAF
ncbi:MAG TPA: Ger(x)C family spore germination protein [Bacillota bacterium]|nr:Ger(x)C family spore germination protein [Bacillota bacterium]